MEPNGIYPNILGLEMSLHHPQNPQNQNPHHHPMAAYGHHDGGDYHLQPQQSAKQSYPSAAKSKNQSLTLSDDDDHGFTPENSADDGKRKMSPWQRMKWTDNMVRLLIMVVYYIGDEVGSETAEAGSKKKGGGGGAMQKKGKWKSVSKAMMERGFYVSPQQCEDKFNDLNKRYKRVNDILGKGTSCRVVENQSLLDTMDHLSAKTKEEVKKLLNSKHLFFREMCAYHNSCSHGGEGECKPSPSPPVEAKNANKCLHSSERDEEDDDDEEEEDDEDDDEEDDEDNRKRGRIGELEGEIGSVMRDGSKSAWEKREWMRGKMMVLEEQHLGIEARAFELEKQRLKWMKFSGKKEREMEREKLRNERMKLENERMVLVIRQKELDLMDFHSKRGDRDPSSITG